MNKEAYLDLMIGSTEMNPVGSKPRIGIRKSFFSGGECHIALKDLDELEGIEAVWVLCHGKGTHNVMEALQASDILRRNGVETVNLYMPYFYYSRQDRATTPESSFALRIFCDILRTANFSAIYTHDLHSSVAQEFDMGVVNELPSKFLWDVWSRGDYDYIIAPDRGATIKIELVCEMAGIPSEAILTATKVRDPATGKLGSPSMAEHSLSLLTSSKALIFDDICDGGYTFIQLGEYLQYNCNCELDLAVTHGIFNKGINSLSRIFGDIYTTDSMQRTAGTIQIKNKEEKI